MKGFFLEVQTIAERSGYASRAYWPPAGYFLDPKKYRELRQLLILHPSLMGLLKEEALAFGKLHPCGWGAIQTLQDLEKELPEAHSLRSEILDRIRVREEEWELRYKTAVISPGDLSRTLESIADENLPTPERLFLLVRIPADPSKAQGMPSPESFQRLVNLLRSQSPLNPLVRSALTDQVCGLLRYYEDTQVWKSAVPVLEQLYLSSRSTAPGISLSLLDRMPVRVFESSASNDPVWAGLGRSLGAILAEELRRSCADGVLMAPQLSSPIAALDWRTASEHLDLAAQALMAGGSRDIKEAGLSLLLPASLYGETSPVAGDLRQKVTRILIQALSNDVDQGTREDIAFRLCGLMKNDKIALGIVETAANSGTLSASATVFLKERIAEVKPR